MSLWDDIKKVGADALNHTVSTIKKQVQTEAQKAKTALLPSIASDAVNAFNGLFRTVKNRVVDAAAATDVAQEVKQREIEKMLPMIAIGAVVLLVVGGLFVLFARGK